MRVLPCAPVRYVHVVLVGCGGDTDSAREQRQATTKSTQIFSRNMDGRTTCRRMLPACGRLPAVPRASTSRCRDSSADWAPLDATLPTRGHLPGVERTGDQLSQVGVGRGDLARRLAGGRVVTDRKCAQRLRQLCCCGRCYRTRRRCAIRPLPSNAPPNAQIGNNIGRLVEMRVYHRSKHSLRGCSHKLV